MPLLHSDSDAHKFTDDSVKIHVAFLNVFYQASVVTESLESEAFQPGLQLGLVAGSLGQKSLPRFTQQASPMFRSRSAGGGGSATRLYQRVEASSCWTLATVRGQGLPAWTLAGKALIAARAASRLEKLP